MEQLNKDISPPADEVKVKVMFKGSKLTMGSSKISTAMVPESFMKNLTHLNKTMLEKIMILTSKKKNQDNGISSVANHNKKKKLTGVCTSNGYIQEENVPRDPTQGGLCLPQNLRVSTINSILYPLQSNRKQFQKAVDDIDVDSMPISCDFDFWLWLEAQKIFAPFSYKTHDLNTIAFQDVGHEEVLSRWCMPAFHSANTATSSSNGEGSTRVSTGDRGMVAQYATTSSRGIDDDPSSAAHIPCTQTHIGMPTDSMHIKGSSIQSSSGSQTMPTLHHQQTEQKEAPFVLPKGYTDLDDHINKLKSQLLHENLKINEILARLRCNSLQTIPVRTELEEYMKQIDKERLILLKWRKSKSYIPPPGGSYSNNNIIGNNYIGNIKGKSNHKRKHSSY